VSSINKLRAQDASLWRDEALCMWTDGSMLECSLLYSNIVQTEHKYVILVIL